MKEFKDSGAWREKYKTWADACTSALGISKRYANRLVADVSGTEFPPEQDAKNTQAKIENLPAPKVSSGSPLSANNQEPEQTSRPTPKSIAPNPPDDNHKPDPKPPEDHPPRDPSGAIIPQHLLSIRERGEEITQATYWASKLKNLFERLQKENDPLFLHVQHSGNVQIFMNNAASMHYQLAECRPEVVCPQCDGKKKDCHTCCGSGWISEVRWNREWVKSSDRLKQGVVSVRSKNL